MSLSVSRWLGDRFAGRRGKVQGRKQGSMIRILRSALSSVSLYTVLTSAAGILIAS